MNTRRLTLAAICMALSLSMAGVAWACPSCQQALATESGGTHYATGVFYSILFMLSMPIAIVGTWAGLVYRMLKRTEAERAEHLARVMRAHEPARVTEEPLDESELA